MLFNAVNVDVISGQCEDSLALESVALKRNSVFATSEFASFLGFFFFFLNK